jgi:hypothetical protein
LIADGVGVNMGEEEERVEVKKERRKESEQKGEKSHFYFLSDSVMRF